MTQIQITEGRSQLSGLNNLVRVFIKGEHSYGYWMDENRLYDLFDKDQQSQYLQSPFIWEFTVSENVSNIIKNEGMNPFKKPSH